MEWFTGPIPEAINASRTNNKLFVVLVYDLTECSSLLLASIMSNSSLLTENAVAIKLESESEEAKQFGQIFAYSKVPSLFFINAGNGKPVEVVTEALSPENLETKIEMIVNDFKGTVAPALSQQGASTSETATPKCEGDVCPVVTDGGSSSSAPPPNDASAPPDSSSTPPTSSSVPDTPSSMGMEERIAYAKTLLQQKQAAIEKEKADKELNDEMQRRNMGKEMRRVKREQEEKEMKELAEKRRKDKLEDKLARERVKAQIAADRAERETRAAILRGEDVSVTQTTSPSTTSPSVPTTGMCRLKLRLPDGSSSIASFEVTAPLSDVHKHVSENIPLPFSPFKLAASVLQRPFTAEDMSNTLGELGLAPSAIVVIMPTGNGSVVPSSDGGFLHSIMQMIMTPITLIIGYIRYFITGQNTQNNNETEDSNVKDETKKRTDRPKTAYGNRRTAPGTRYRRDGNIHRLGGDDSDENNTYNGNSTQQM